MNDPESSFHQNGESPGSFDVHPKPLETPSSDEETTSQNDALPQNDATGTTLADELKEIQAREGSFAALQALAESATAEQQQAGEAMSPASVLPSFTNEGITPEQKVSGQERRVQYKEMLSIPSDELQHITEAALIRARKQIEANPSLSGKDALAIQQAEYQQGIKEYFARHRDDVWIARSVNGGISWAETNLAAVPADAALRDSNGVHIVERTEQVSAAEDPVPLTAEQSDTLDSLAEHPELLDDPVALGRIINRVGYDGLAQIRRALVEAFKPYIPRHTEDERKRRKATRDRLLARLDALLRAGRSGQADAHTPA